MSSSFYAEGYSRKTGSYPVNKLMCSHKVKLIGIAFPFKDTPIAPVDVELPEVRALYLVELQRLAQWNYRLRFTR